MTKLTLIATGAVASVLALAGCAAPQTTTSSSSETTVAADTTTEVTVDTSGNTVACTGTATATPSLTEGPYYKTGDFVRSDITEGQSGLPMTLTLAVVDTNCNPIPNATVDIWHANAQGQYSGVSDPKEGCAECVNMTFLRGSQTTDASGQVTFETIFPGWYPGRTVHIHVKVWQDGQQVLTTQLFVTKADADTAYATTGYKGEQNTTNEQDGIAQQAGAGLTGLTLINVFDTDSVTSSAQLVLG